MDRDRQENVRRSEILLDSEDILKASYSVRRAGFPAYQSLTPDPSYYGLLLNKINPTNPLVF